MLDIPHTNRHDEDEIDKVFILRDLAHINPENRKKSWECFLKTTEGKNISPKKFGLVLIGNIISIMVLMIFTSFTGFLQDFSTNHANGIIPLILNICTLILMGINFITHCIRINFTSGKIHTYLYDIIQAYMESIRFFVDFTVVMFNIAFLAFTRNETLGKIFYFYLIIVYLFSLKDLNWLNYWYFETDNQKRIEKLLQIITVSFFFAHFIASILLSFIQFDTEDNWAKDNGLDQVQYYILYGHALYWACTMMMGVGFGDFSATNTHESYILAFLEIFSCLFVAYRLLELILFLKEFRQWVIGFSEQIGLFERMVEQKEKNMIMISKSLKNNIHNYLKAEQTQKAKHKYHSLDKLLTDFPEDLRKAYYSEIAAEAFEKIIFFENLKNSTVRMITSGLISMFFQPNATLNKIAYNIVILDEGTVGFACAKRGSQLNGIVKTQITIKQEDKAQFICTRFLNPIKRINYDIVAVTSALIWQIQINKFEALIKKSNKQDYQYYFCIVHKSNFDEDIWQDIECPHCKNVKHTAFECPKLHYFPMKSLKISKLLELPGSPQKRKTIKRRPHKSTLSNIFVNIRRQQTKKSRKIQQTNHLIIQSGTKRNNRPRNYSLVSEQDHLIRLLSKSLQAYKTNYYDEYWDIEADIIENYQFYFPLCNANRLLMTPVSRIRLLRKSSWRLSSR